jgi:molybdopterin-containing oxidoreductase family iron-sulfur binding subunit
LTNEAVRDRLRVARGRDYWRTLDEYAETDEFRDALTREFPDQIELWTDPTGRRDFLKVMGASLALAGLAGCEAVQPHEEILPYVQMPEQLIPGKPMFYATTMTLGGYGVGLLAESHMGRPTRVEGNPRHPAVPAPVPDTQPAEEAEGNVGPNRGPGRRRDLFLGGPTDVFAQASILQMYDPDRSQTVQYRGRIRPYSDFTEALRERIRAAAGNGGAGVRILTGTATSPTLLDQVARLRMALPEARWHQFEPLNNDSARRGALAAFGQDVHPVYHFDRADVILSLGSDFLQFGPGHLQYANEFVDRRRVLYADPQENRRATMNRLYVVEGTPTLAGSKADHRLAVRPSQIPAIAARIAAELGVDVEPPTMEIDETLAQWIREVARDLRPNRNEGRGGAEAGLVGDGPSLVIAGDDQPAVVHALAHAINAQLGNVGANGTVEYLEPFTAQTAGHLESLQALVEDMQAGDVQTLIILGGNPAYTAPEDFGFSAALLAKDEDGNSQVPFRVHLSLYQDETSRLCDWHVPMAHYLESWGDARAYEGTASLVQPLIAPLYEGHTAYELLAVMLGETDATGYDVVRGYWQRQYQGDQFEIFWRTALHEGVIPAENDANRPQAANVSVQAGWATDLADELRPGDENGFEILFKPDPSVRDGEFANNGWLQELPRPFTKLTWDNAALVSPKTADGLGVRDAGRLSIRLGGQTLEMPVFRLPGQPEKTITLHLGYGREFAGRIGTGVGGNAYKLRTSEQPWLALGARVTPVGGDKYLLSTTQNHYTMENRDLIRAGRLGELHADPTAPSFAQPMHPLPVSGQHARQEVGEGGKDHPEYDELPSLYPEREYTGHKWGMVIDLTACIGCNACTIACQSENNIPIVGKQEVARGREMHWIRVDTYYRGGADEPEEIDHQPVPCMHCEYAPCEVVCPVNATTHSPEGINEMTYNRCIGTRYCSNNCPYKVRRFNFLEWTKPIKETPVLHLLQNPDVTVRSRGVMEKCTYCIQRIQQGRIEAETSGRTLEDGDIVTACQSACPTRAIVFGDLNEEGSAVRRAADSPLVYGLLEDLNTRPRTRYAAIVRNPNPRLAPTQPRADHGQAH